MLKIHPHQLKYLFHQSDLCSPDILQLALFPPILRNSFDSPNIAVWQIYCFSAPYFSTLGWPRCQCHRLLCGITCSGAQRGNQERLTEGSFAGGGSQGNIFLLFPLKTTRAVVPRATSMPNRLIQRFHNAPPPPLPPPNPLLCDLQTSSVTQYFPGGGWGGEGGG